MSFPGPYTHVVQREQVPVKGHPLVLHYGEGRRATAPPPTDRAYARRTARHREMFSLPTVFHDGQATTPAFPTYLPTRVSYGQMTLVRLMRCEYEDGASEMFAELRCSCGSLSAIQASYWRGNPPNQCNPCARGSKQRRRFAAGYFCVQEWPAHRVKK